MVFDSLDIRDGGEGERRWREADRPLVPSVVVDGAITPILHVSQLAAALGLPVPQAPASTRLAWETLPVLRSWLDHLRGLDWETLTKPTPSRGRSLRNLTVNVFHPFGLLPAAWRAGSFPFSALLDSQLEHASFHHAQLVGFLRAEGRLGT